MEECSQSLNMATSDLTEQPCASETTLASSHDLSSSQTAEASTNDLQKQSEQSSATEALESLEVMVPFEVPVMNDPFGMQIHILNGVPCVFHVIVGTPAEQAGVLKGFVLTKIEEQEVSGDNWFDVYKKTRLPMTLTFDIKILKSSLKDSCLSEGLVLRLLQIGMYHTPEGSPLGDGYQDFWCTVSMLPFLMQIPVTQTNSWARVESVAPGSMVDVCGVLAGDVLISVADHRVTSHTWYAALSAATVPVELHFRRPIRSKSDEELKYKIRSAKSVREFEEAITAAQDNGVQGSLVQEAQGQLQDLKKDLLTRDAKERQAEESRERCISRLKLLIEAGEAGNVSAKDLEAAIADAEDVGAPEVLLREARASLQQISDAIIEKHKQDQKDAWDMLERARDKGDSGSLKTAIVEAKRVKLDESDLYPFIELLRRADVRERAESALQKAVQEKNVPSMRFAIKQACEANVSKEIIACAEEILRIEEPKELTRANLVAAIQKGRIPDLRVAVANAKAVGLEPNEYSVAEDLLNREEKKEIAVAEVRRALARLQTKSTSSLEELTSAKTLLSGVIGQAVAAGVCEADLAEADKRRRVLHNNIEDMKGSIRVFCRIRPLDSREARQGDVSVTKPLDGMTLSLYARDDVSTFGFDAVFTPGTQEEIFDNCKDLVQSAIDGYNVTMFAYGQTGAGKTYTMSGSPGCDGIAPRTIREVFRLTELNRDRFEFRIFGSFCELYRNDLVDLLAKNSNVFDPATKLNVRMEKSGTVQIDNLMEEECADVKDLTRLLNAGTARRRCAATTMNSESSRSHSILTIRICSLNYETREELCSKILLCDLAGSERLKKCELVGDIQKEAIEINKSLTALGDVIEALTKRHSQIPYRNHKLTQVMSDSLGGTAKTLMFVNCSPASSNADETLMSLRFSTRAKHVTNHTVRQRSLASASGLSTSISGFSTTQSSQGLGSSEQYTESRRILRSPRLSMPPPPSTTNFHYQPVLRRTSAPTSKRLSS